MRQFSQLYWASLREWRRDSTALLWSLIFPVMIALVVGFIFSSSGTMFFKVGVVNEAGHDAQVVVDSFTANDAFHISEGSRADELDALHDGKRDAVVIIPPRAAKVIMSHSIWAVNPEDQVPVEVFYDPTSSNAQGVASLIQQTLVTFDARLTGRLPLLSMQLESANANRLRSADTMLPGVLAMSLMLMGLYVTALPLVSLREKEVLRRMGVTPLSRGMLLAAQVAFRMTVAAIQAGVVIMISVGLFDLPLKPADLPAVIGLVLLGAAVFITLGYFLAALARTEEAVQVVVNLAFLVFTMLSGVLVPLWRIPGWLRPLVDAIPLTYLADALRQVMVGASPAYSMTTNLLVLAAWLAACTLLSLRFFRWEPRG